MEQINSMVSVRANTPVKNDSKTSSPIDKIKQKIDEVPDGAKKIAAGLGALSAIAIATIAIVKHKNAGKAVNEVKEEVAEAASKVVDKTSKTVVRKTVQKAPETIAQEAVDKVADGANYQKIRREATRNLTHNEKAVVKEKLSEFNASLNKARQERLIERGKNAKVAKGAPAIAEQANQGMKSARTVEEINARVSAAQQAANSAKVKASELAQNTSTKGDVRRATYAQHKYEQAQRNANIVEENAQKRAQELIDQAEKKAENIAKMQATKGYEAGLEKQAVNAQNTMANAIKRDYNQQLNKYMKKHAGESKYKLEASLKNGKYADETEKTAIMQLLAGLKK